MDHRHIEPSQTAVRSQFLESLTFAPDQFQVQAFDQIDANESVLVAAPTSSGKTLVAEYAIHKALNISKRAFYTAPIKALSNQKYLDLCELFGSNSVGLLTGDNTINADAPIIVMTTEVLRNMIYSDSARLDNLAYVVLDEVHYLQDQSRGPVWEEVIIHLPLHIDLVCLSATISNAEQFADWISTIRGTTSVVVSHHRPVPLQYFVAFPDIPGSGSRRVGKPALTPLLEGDESTQLMLSSKAKRLDSATRRKLQLSKRPIRGRGPRVRLIDLVEVLSDKQMLPAIFFIMSRSGCDRSFAECADNMRLTSHFERNAIREIVERHVGHVDSADLDTLGFSHWLARVEQGFAAHHAGIVPPFREAVEECFTAGLIKVVFATETLAYGINMPARTVVVESITKRTDNGFTPLEPAQFTQLIGRAGRRGYDDHGNVVTCWSATHSAEEIAEIATNKEFVLKSAFRPTYNITANLVRRHSREEANRLLNQSFAQFGHNASVTHREQSLSRLRTQIDELESKAAGIGNLGEYVETSHLLRQANIHLSKARRIEVSEVFETLKVGDVIRPPTSENVVAVVVQEPKGDGTDLKLRVVRPDLPTRFANYSVEEFDFPPNPLGMIELPMPIRIRDVKWRKAVAESLTSFQKSDFQAGSGSIWTTQDVYRGMAVVESLKASLSSNEVHQDPNKDERVSAYQRIPMLRRQAEQERRALQSTTDSLSHAMNQLQDLMAKLGYLDKQAWQLTPQGQLLSMIYAEADLLVTDSLLGGEFDELAPHQFAALVSCFVFEDRGSNSPASPKPIADYELNIRLRSINRRHERISKAERRFGLMPSRGLNQIFMSTVFDWCLGKDLRDVLKASAGRGASISGGDFVRWIKQVTDLTRQLSEHSPNPETRACADSAGRLLMRDVVALSSAIAAPSLEASPLNNLNDQQTQGRGEGNLSDKMQSDNADF